MIKRIVKLHIRPEEQDTFKELFLRSKSVIQSFDCHYVECLQAIDTPEVFFTYSHWPSVEALNVYRHSDEFESIWTQTKAIFGGRAEAWSTSEVITPLNN